MKKIFLILIGYIYLIVSSSFNVNEENKKDIYPELDKYINKILKEIKHIPADRKEQLNELVAVIKSNKSLGHSTNLLFICTHNSRRSHMAQIWCQTAAYYYNIENLYCYSGGTEATAFNHRAINAMTNAGFRITKSMEKINEKDTIPISTSTIIPFNTTIENPIYEVRYSDTKKYQKIFSKKYNDNSNPKGNFCAIMTCSQADKECPIIEGASERISIPYEDPKVFDKTKDEEIMYQERCKQIVIEMFYVLSLID